MVVDDGSPDGTAMEAEAAGARVLRHPFNLGYGAVAGVERGAVAEVERVPHYARARRLGFQRGAVVAAVVDDHHRQLRVPR